MRKRLARTLAVLSGIMVVVLSATFAAVMNPSVGDDAGGAPTAAGAGKQAQIARGRELFREEDCVRCHSIGGVGGRRSPLDDIARHMDAAEMRDWILGTDAVRDGLSPSALNAKRVYRSLPPEDIDALIVYLQSL
ncbi:c-type cytochrome [Marilutibacter alkalisoli]|uniref:Cytochrome c n=1 Tax=Marilutibacter alkalisoli TaxID=2591633 RepID=A0A514BRN2_9GAMM|nr:cytochrome c [Lysobacter alkalisoli]QDH70043.1 cytochrome c [Lysobacter alkalisoli]